MSKMAGTSLDATLKQFMKLAEAGKEAVRQLTLISDQAQLINSKVGFSK